MGIADTHICNQLLDSIAIGGIEVDFLSNTIRNDEREVRLEPKVMALLRYLAERHGQVVTREDLESEVWKDVVVGYDALNISVAKLRKAFNDDSRHPTFIETIPKVGYRLVAKIEPTAGNNKASQTEILETFGASNKMPWQLTIVGLVLLIVAGLLAWFVPWSESEYPQLPDRPSLVVLPLKNFSESGQESLSVAISEGITGGLSRFSGLFVISSDSANFYRDGTKTPKQIGQELGVRYVLTGSMQRSGDQLKINMQLVDARNQSSVWAENYSRVANDVFVVQDEIVHSVTTTLGETIWQSAAGNLKSKPLEDFAAFDYLLQAKQVFHELTSESNLEARRLLRKAFEIDPELGLPYLLMAWSYYLEFRAQWEDTDPKALDKAMEYLRQAEAKMGRDYEVHRLLAKINQVSGEFDKALMHSERALELNPNDGDLLATHAQMLTRAGESESAQRWIEQAMRRNPHYPPWYAAVLAITQYLQGEYSQAVDTLNKVGNLPVWGLRYLIASYGQLGKLDDARQPIELLLEQSPEFRVSDFGARVEFRLDSDKQHLLDGLIKAGLPM